MNFQIFTCYHKEAPVVNSDIIVPIQGGRSIAKNKLEMIGDDTGDNISSKNLNFCELTVTYWIWKNATADVVGLCHYRRYFNFKNLWTMFDKINPDFAEKFGINKTNLENLIKENDIIVPKTMDIGCSLREKYNRDHLSSDMDATLEAIKEVYPNDYETAKKVLENSTRGHFCNMIIAKKEAFDNYAKWLFDILFFVENKIQKDVENRDAIQRRVYGYLSERLMSVYLACHSELKVLELPMLVQEENTNTYKKYCSKMKKRIFLGKLGFKNYKKYL
ncbi:MAG: DUF4422 domain-containing protein [Alphaproteobacteria bacterium]|nr:DUF4422 domain-containing protein [Alphaproteobacteria bacterium]